MPARITHRTQPPILTLCFLLLFSMLGTGQALAEAPSCDECVDSETIEVCADNAAMVEGECQCNGGFVEFRTDNGSVRCAQPSSSGGVVRDIPPVYDDCLLNPVECIGAGGSDAPGCSGEGCTEPPLPLDEEEPSCEGCINSVASCVKGARDGYGTCMATSRQQAEAFCTNLNTPPGWWDFETYYGMLTGFLRGGVIPGVDALVPQRVLDLLGIDPEDLDADARTAIVSGLFDLCVSSWMADRYSAQCLEEAKESEETCHADNSCADSCSAPTTTQQSATVSPYRLAASRSVEVRSQRPTVDGLRVDYCLNEGRDCGNEAAHAYCGERYGPGAIALQWDRETTAAATVHLNTRHRTLGITPGGHLYRWTGEVFRDEALTGLSRIAMAADGTTIALRTDGQTLSIEDGSIQSLGAPMRQVSAGSASQLWGVDFSDRLHRHDGSSWQDIGISMMQISAASDGSVWGVNTLGHLVRWNGQAFELINSGSWAEISVGSRAHIWGLTTNNKVTRWNGRGMEEVDGSPTVARLSIAADGTVWAIGTDLAVYERLSGEWRLRHDGSALTDIAHVRSEDAAGCEGDACEAFANIWCQVHALDERIEEPRVDGYRVGICEYKFSGPRPFPDPCGQPAADRFCQERFGSDAVASDWLGAPSVGSADAPTLTLQDRELCTAETCGSFQQITCRSGTTLQAMARVRDIYPDQDEDGIPDSADLCVDEADGPLAGPRHNLQRDRDGDGQGDACDATPIIDLDADGIHDLEDNCLGRANAKQRDTDGDLIGDACDPDSNQDGRVGNPDFALFAGSYGAKVGEARFDERTDSNGDGRVGNSEYMVFRSYFGREPGPSALRWGPQQFGGVVEAQRWSVATTGRAGQSMATIGDLDGDGIPEVAVGAPTDGAAGISRGAVHIVFPNADGSVRRTQKIGPGQGGFAPLLANYAYFGEGLAGVGDLNGDGRPELAVGAPGYNSRDGGIWILELDTDGTVTSHLEISGATHSGIDHEFGTSIAPIGDIDDNGTIDLAVGAPDAFPGGVVYIVKLRSDRTMNSYSMIGIGTPGLTEIGDFSAFGSELANVGDLDGDGYDELAVGAPLDDTIVGGNGGAVWIVGFRSGGLVDHTQKLVPGVGGFTGTVTSYDNFGAGLAAIGDLDGDGRQELAVGAPKSEAGGTVWLLSLTHDGRVDQIRSIHGQDEPMSGSDRSFGTGVAGLGDLDGDGTIEVLVGADRDNGNWLLSLEAAER